MTVVTALVASVLAVVISWGATARVAGAVVPGASMPMYDVAMGDSLAAGTGASSTGARYVNVLYQHERSRFPTLQLENIACGGATTNSVINGPGCSYATGTQLGDAEAFLRAHPGQVPLLTIDIGANNVDGCQVGTTISPSCVANGEGLITSQLPQILRGLEAAYPGLAIYGMDYYDPFLGEWLSGAGGQSVARASVPFLVQLNALLGGLYAAGGAATADPTALFDTSDFAPTGKYLGVAEPQNVANICNWTLFCSGAGNIHANDIGHFLVAVSFVQAVDHVTVPQTPLPAGSTRVRYSAVLAAGGGHPPYRWSLAAGSRPLPPGLRLTSAGVVSGRPTASGTYPFTVRAEDTKLQITSPPVRITGTATLSITVG